MENFEKTIRQAEKFATRNHGLQDYDGFPYDVHLDKVVDVLKRFGYSGHYLIAGYLHDILEDCPVSYSDIKKLFGEQVAEIVYCVTDELGRNRKERKEKTYPKIRSNQDAIIVKLADRIANVEHSIQMEHRMNDMYIKEYKDFKYNLQLPNHALEMWKCLDELLLPKEDLSPEGREKTLNSFQ